MTFLRLAAGLVALVWWAPTIALMLAHLAWREAVFAVRLARVRRSERDQP